MLLDPSLVCPALHPHIIPLPARSNTFTQRLCCVLMLMLRAHSARVPLPASHHALMQP